MMNRKAHTQSSSAIQCIQSKKSNHDYVNNSRSNSTAHMPVSSLDPSDPWLSTHIVQEKRCPGRISSPIKEALCQAVLIINLACPNQEDTWSLDVWCKERSNIIIKYSVKIEPRYFEWDTLIPTLEKHFLDILRDIGQWSPGAWLWTRSRSVNTNK